MCNHSSSTQRQHTTSHNKPQTTCTDGSGLRVQGWWDHLDHNNNGIVSLAEIKKFVQDKQWKVADPALMQAYKYATARGDDFVQKREFPRLLRGMVFMNRLWDLFDEMDTSDDRRCV